MKVLLDTNIIIHRESKAPIKEDIGKLFYWIDKLGYIKCIHPITIDEIKKYKDPKERKAMLIKIRSYFNIPLASPLDENVKLISQKYDMNEKDKNDTLLLNEVYIGNVNILITEDKKLHKKAQELGIDNKVFTIEQFLEKAYLENPSLIEYKDPIIKQCYFSELDLNDHFFDSLKEDYKGFENWFRKKAYEKVYVCKSDKKILGLLYLKMEGEGEPYTDISPPFKPKKRLKIGTIKVELQGFKLGERFLKIVFDNALHFGVEEIYLSTFKKREGQIRLISLLESFGFYEFGDKYSNSGAESVFVRDFSKRANRENPRLTFPYMSRKARKFLVPIWPKYHTRLLPDSILKTESPMDFKEIEPFKNAISKVYVSRSLRRDLKPGDILIFYRTANGNRAYYRSVVTTLGIVEKVITSIRNVNHLIELCKKRTVLKDEELVEYWNKDPGNPPFVVYFLYAYSLPKRINLKRLIELGVIEDIKSAPRGFEEINDDSFNKIIGESNANPNIVVD